MDTTAARITDHSGRLVVEQVALPEPGPGEVLVALTFAGTNPVDRYGATGLVAPGGPLPRTLGGEASGVLDGRPVLVAGGGLGAARDGVWARHAVVPRSAVHAVPAGVDPQQVAAAGVAGLTAWSCVVELGAVTAADRVLVLGAAGGVGLAVVALAASLGAQVWGQVRSAGRAEAVTAVGAAGAVVAGPGELADAATHVRPTVVLDALGGEFVAPALGLLQPGGRAVVYGTSAGAQVQLDWQAVYRSGLQVLGYGGQVLPDAERRRRLHLVLAALADGRLTIPVGRVVPLSRAQEVVDPAPAGAPPGKTLLDLSA